MGKLVLKDASVTVNDVDLSDHVRSVTLTETWDTENTTAMGDDFKVNTPTLGDCEIVVEFWQDYAAAEVDATLHSLAGSQTPFDVVVKPTSAAVSATNPSYTQSSILPSYQPFGGQVGSVTTVPATFKNADGAGITRATS
jgi:hypothetical protein